MHNFLFYSCVLNVLISGLDAFSFFFLKKRRNEKKKKKHLYFLGLLQAWKALNWGDGGIWDVGKVRGVHEVSSVFLVKDLVGWCSAQAFLKARNSLENCSLMINKRCHENSGAQHWGKGWTETGKGSHSTRPHSSPSFHQHPACPLPSLLDLSVMIISFYFQKNAKWNSPVILIS